MMGGRRTYEEKICHTCGHAGFSAAIATCSLCKLSQHTYCMRSVCFEVPEEWLCEVCLGAEAVDNEQVQGKQVETTRAIGSSSAKQEMLQFSHKKSSRKVEAGKVKFMSSEEVITLASGKRPKGNPCVSGYHGDFADFKSPISMKPALPSSKVLKPPLRPTKRPVCTGVGISSSNKATELEHVSVERETKTALQVCKTKLAKFRTSSLANFACTTPNDVRCDDLDLLHADDQRIKENKAPLEPQSDCLFIKKEPANVSLAIKEERASPKRIEGNSLPVNDSCTAACSISQFRQISSSETFLPLKLVVSSDEEHYHALEACWRGAFEVMDLVPQFHSTVHAHLSCQVSPKVYDISKQFPGTLQLKLLPRVRIWPKIFKLNRPTKDDVAMYFKCELKRDREKYAHFVQHIDLHDYALQGCIANVELLLFASTQLQIDSHQFDGCRYLWSVFRHVRRKNASQSEEKAVTFVTSTPVCLMHDKSNAPIVGSLEGGGKVNMLQHYPVKADMEIDMVGGRPFGRVDIPIKCKDAPSGFSKAIQGPHVNFYPQKSDNSDLMDSPPGFPVPRYKQFIPAAQGRTGR